jgi:general secretion pathway protein N
MTFKTKLLLTGIGAYGVFLIATLPATLLFKFTHGQVQAGAISGTIWHGKATTLQAGVLNLGDAEWTLHVMPVFIGRIGADLKLIQPKGFAQGRFDIAFNGTVSASKLTASLPIESLLGSGGLPGGWTGTAQFKLDELVLKNNWPSVAKGTVDVIDITGPANEPANLGSYRITFPGPNTSTTELVGNLQDLDGAVVGLSGKLTIKADRNYQLDSLIAQRPNTPSSITQGMQFLGEADAQGRRPFSLSGSM